MLKNRGFTLIEVMISIAIASIVLLALMTLMVTGIEFSSVFDRKAGTTEFMSDGLTQLSSNIPQIVRLRSCNCSTGAADGNCSWSSASPLRDPVIDLAQASPITLLDADIENGDGGTANAAADQTLTANLPGGAYGCGANIRLATSRGCRQRIQLVYTAPVQESGPTPSRPGQLAIRTSSVANPAAYSETKIGDRNTKIGISKVSCGLVQQAAGEIGSIFAINILFKVRANIIENPTSAIYQSFHPSSAKFNAAASREVLLRFSLANLSNRGAYQWKARFQPQCSKIGTNVAGRNAACCTGAVDASGNNCAACVESGGAATDARQCCSEALNGGVCK